MSSRSRRASEQVSEPVKEGNPLYSGEYTYDDWIREHDELDTAYLEKRPAWPSEGYIALSRLMRMGLDDYDAAAGDRIRDLYRQALGGVKGATSWPRWSLEAYVETWDRMSLGRYFRDFYGLSDSETVEILRDELQRMRDRYEAEEAVRPQVEEFIDSEMPDLYALYRESYNVINPDNPFIQDEDGFIHDRTKRALKLMEQAERKASEDPDGIEAENPQDVIDWREDLRQYHEFIVGQLDRNREIRARDRDYDDLEEAGYGPMLEAADKALPEAFIPETVDFYLLKDNGRRATIAEIVRSVMDEQGLPAEASKIPKKAINAARKAAASWPTDHAGTAEDGERLPPAHEVRRRYWKGGEDGERPEGAAIPMDPETGKAMLYMTTDNLMGSLTDYSFQTALDDYRFSDSKALTFSNEEETKLKMTLYVPADPDSPDVKAIVLNMTEDHRTILNYIGSRCFTTNSKDFHGTKPYKTNLNAFVDGLIKTNGDGKLNKEQLAPQILDLLKMMRQCSVKIDFTEIRRKHSEDVWKKLKEGGFDDRTRETALLDLDIIEDPTADGIEYELEFLRMPPIYLYGVLVNQFVPYDSALLMTPPTKVLELDRRVARNMALTLNLTGTGSNSGMISLEQDLINREMKEWVLRAVLQRLRIKRTEDPDGPIILDLDMAFRDIYGIKFPKDTKDPEYKRLKDQRNRLRKNIEIYLAFLIEKGFLAFVKRRVVKSRANGTYRITGWFVYKSEKSFNEDIAGIVHRIEGGEPFYEPGTAPRQQVKADEIKIRLRQLAP